MTHVFHQLAPTKDQVLHCQFSHWYPLYKKHTPKAKVIRPLPKAFIDYLAADGIDLPEDGHYEVNMGTGDGEYSDWSEDEEASTHSSDEDEDEDDDDDDKQVKIKTPKRPVAEIFEEFQSIHDDIKATIKEMGPVTPKMNWSAPRDAVWIMATNTMKCDNASDVYLLLNASNYIMHDISSAFSECDGLTEDDLKDVQYELVLRKWFNVNPALEFRVFVKDRHIIGITQRDLNFYDYLDALKPTIRNLVDEFFETVIVDTFPDDDFVMDVYLPRPFDKVFLIDINPFSRKTDSQMYTWHELASMNPETIEEYDIRLVTETDKGRFATKEHSENMVPMDVVNASLDSHAMAELAQQWKELQMKGGDDGEKAT